MILLIRMVRRKTNEILRTKEGRSNKVLCGIHCCCKVEEATRYILKALLKCYSFRKFKLNASKMS